MDPWPRRVLMTADTVGGVWSYSRDLAAGLAANGTQVLLAAMGGWASSRQRQEIAGLDGVELVDSGYALEWMAEPWEDVAASCSWLQDLAKSFQPDLIHCNTYAHATMDWNLPVVLVAHSCVCTWFEAVHGCEPPTGQWDRYRDCVAAARQSADLVIAPTGAMLEAFTRHHGRPPVSRAIPNGIAADRYHERDGGSLILSAGRAWDEGKNLALLERIASRLPWPIAVAGATRAPGGGEIRFAHLRQLGTLPREELAGRMSAAGIFAHPARYEPFGLVILEAALSGCALVLADLPSLRELWQGAACFVDPYDEDAWQAALTHLCRDRGARRRLSRASRRRALDYGMERMIADYRSAYAGLLQAKRPASAA
jgi:glycogen(starch) synthase